MKKTTLVSLVLASSIIVPAFAFAADATTTGAMMEHHAAMTIDYACVQKAVDTREGAIGSAFATFSAAETSALSARAAALNTAWGTTDATARRAARNKAWSDFRTANRAAYTALRTAKKSAWATFTTDSKVCKAPVVESASAEGMGSLGL